MPVRTTRCPCHELCEEMIGSLENPDQGVMFVGMANEVLIEFLLGNRSGG